MNYKSIFKNLFSPFKPAVTNYTNEQYDNALPFLFEDDYLMIELLPAESIAFVKVEIDRINGFAEEHLNETGYNRITVTQPAAVKTADKHIKISAVESIIQEAGLSKMTRFNMQGVGIINTENTIGFGTLHYALMCEQHNGELKNIWIANSPGANEQERKKLIAALAALAKGFDFIAVNWYAAGWFEINTQDLAKEFVRVSW